MTGRPRVAPAALARRRRFSHAIHARRVLLGWSQPQLAEAAGCDRQSISRVENGRYCPSLDRCFALADALGVLLSELVADADSGP